MIKYYFLLISIKFKVNKNLYSSHSFFDYLNIKKIYLILKKICIEKNKKAKDINLYNYKFYN